MDTSKIYRIPAVNMARVKKTIDSLNARASKLGCEPVVLTVIGETVEKHVSELLGIEYDQCLYECTLSGVAPKLCGWSFIAVIEPLKGTEENVIREVPGHVCPKDFRLTDMHCDHCGVIRKRNGVFVLRSEAGLYKQVGRTCLEDFLGGVSPQSTMEAAQFLLRFERAISGGKLRGSVSEPSVDLHYFVTMVASVIRSYGWVPKSQADYSQEATASKAFRICMGDEEAALTQMKKFGLSIIDIDLSLARDAIAWAKNIDHSEAQNNYLHDLGVCCRANCVTQKTYGYVASVVSAYQRAMIDTEKRKHLPSDHVGVVDERIVLERLRVASMNDVEGGMYPRTKVRLYDTSGNAFVWWASGKPDWLSVSDVVDVKATINKHETYSGVKQTVLKRVRPNTN